jgi:hypothetical protein
MTATPPTLALDRQAAKVLEELGFVVGDEGAAARIGGVTVSVRRVVDPRAPEFEIAIVLPGGAVLKTSMRRRELLAASEGVR